jgi:hypothetical protein
VTRHGVRYLVQAGELRPTLDAGDGAVVVLAGGGQRRRQAASAASNAARAARCGGRCAWSVANREPRQLALPLYGDRSERSLRTCVVNRADLQGQTEAESDKCDYGNRRRIRNEKFRIATHGKGGSAWLQTARREPTTLTPLACQSLDPLTPAETATVLAGLYLVVNRAQLPASIHALAGGELLDDVATNRLIADLEHGRLMLRRLRPNALDARRI